MDTSTNLWQSGLIADSVLPGALGMTTTDVGGAGRGSLRRLFSRKEVKETSRAVIVGVLSIVATVLLRVIEAFLSQSVSVNSATSPENIRDFIFSEYFAVGSDLIVVAFSLLVSPWIASKPETGKLGFPALLIFILALMAIGMKGAADQFVKTAETKIISLATPAPPSGGSSLFERFQVITSECKNADTKQTAKPTELINACNSLEGWKGIQIFVPNILGLITIMLAAVGIARN
jgi:hypothetical protein